MLEIFTMALHHSNIIMNVILIGAFLLNLIFAFIIIFMETNSKFHMGLVACTRISPINRLYFIFIIRSSNSTRPNFQIE